MHSRPGRRIVAAALLTTALTAGGYVFALHLTETAAFARSTEAAALLEQMIFSVGDISIAQQAYLAPGQPDQSWLERSSAVLSHLSTDAVRMRQLVNPTVAQASIDAVERALETLAAADQKVRRNIALDQNVLAADVIFNEGRDAASVVTARLRQVKADDQLAATALRDSIERRQWRALAAVALSWFVGLAVLLPLPAQRPVQLPDSGLHQTATAPAPAEVTSKFADFNAAADVCSSFACASDTAALREALERAAGVLKARGIVVWLGIGDDLFPVLIHGYEDRFVRSLGPIRRVAENITAEAWRTGQVRTTSGSGSVGSAIAAPLQGMSGCAGVFTAEFLGGEVDPPTLAVTKLFAAQLAAAVSLSITAPQDLALESTASTAATLSGA